VLIAKFVNKYHDIIQSVKGVHFGGTAESQMRTTPGSYPNNRSSDCGFFFVFAMAAKRILSPVVVTKFHIFWVWRKILHA